MSSIDFDNGGELRRAPLDRGDTFSNPRTSSRVRALELGLRKRAYEHLNGLSPAILQDPSTIANAHELLTFLHQELTVHGGRIKGHGVMISNDQNIKGMTIYDLIDQVFKPHLLKEYETIDAPVSRWDGMRRKAASIVPWLAHGPSMCSFLIDTGDSFNIPFVILGAYLQHRHRKGLPVPAAGALAGGSALSAPSLPSREPAG